MAHKYPDYRLAPVSGSDERPGIYVTSGNTNRREFIFGSFAAAGAVAMFPGAMPLAAAPALKAHSGGVIALAVSPDGAVLASGSGNRELKLWSLSTLSPAPKSIRTGPEQIYSLSFSPDGKLLCCGFAAGEIEVRSMPDGTLINRWAAHAGKDVLGAAFITANDMLVTGGTDGRVCFWRLRSPTPTNVKVYPLNAGEVRSLAISSDRRTLAVACEREIRVWEVTPSPLAIRPVWTAEPDGDILSDVAITADNIVVSSSYDGKIRVHRRDRTMADTLSGHTVGVQSIRWVPAGDRLISCSDDKTVRIWSVQDGKQITVLSGHDDAVASVASMPDGRRAFSGGSDGVIIAWNIHGGTMEGFLFDPASNQPSSTGITYTARDQVTGHVLTFTLPCGSPIPPGATCVCNCVPGTYVPYTPPPVRYSPPRSTPGGTIRQPCTYQPVPPGYICQCNCIPGR